MKTTNETIEISINIETAKNDFPTYYHVVNSQEVHSFATIAEAKKDLADAKIAEKKMGSEFLPKIIKQSK